MIFFRIRRHSPAATVRFAPKLQAGAGVATAASMARAGLMTMGSGLARHTFAGLA